MDNGNGIPDTGKTESLADAKGTHGNSASRFISDRLLVVGKSRVYPSGPSSLLELKDAIRKEVSSIHPDMLHSAVAGFVSRLEYLLPCGGGHVEHILV
ncbi:hypothetical protein TNCV_3046861 [Trichonephila clavipes]|uniref:Uncharacterized protein n=1 Tax=Trichonephila clavipes TaxID=2585209 RepID=A0A8X6V6L8_TRICX|nr:hypothetical protein TNCV_3046861 [Trichonephila clavipes]